MFNIFILFNYLFIITHVESYDVDLNQKQTLMNENDKNISELNFYSFWLGEQFPIEIKGLK